MKLTFNFLDTESGATSAEYALIVALIAGVIFTGVSAIGTDIAGAIMTFANTFAAL